MLQQRDFFDDQLKLMKAGYAFLLNRQTGRREGRFETVAAARQCANYGIAAGFSTCYSVRWRKANGGEYDCGEVTA